jgi:hypothetical protein
MADHQAVEGEHMNLTSKIAAVAGCAALAAFPALAGADKPTHPGSQGQGHAVPHGQGHSKRCKKPATSRGYVATGTYGDTGAFTPFVAATDTTAAVPGSLSFTVTHTNHHAVGATSPFSFTTAKVTFDSPTATAPAATDTVRVIGKILVAKKGCTLDPSVNPVTIRKFMFIAPSSSDTGDTPDTGAATTS